MRRLLSLLTAALLILTPSSSFAERWFFEDLPRHIGNDFKETFYNGGHLFLLAAGTIATAGVHDADSSIRQAFDPEDPLGGAADLFNVMGNSLVLGGATVAALGISALAGAPKATLTAGTMLEAFAITTALTFGLKFAVGRDRPDGSDSRSFPSGHASGSFALATVAEVFYGPWVGIPSYTLASLIALSRIDKNKHFASDTVAGALLGTLIGLGTAKWHKKKFPKFFILPTTGENGAGLTFNHSF